MTTVDTKWPLTLTKNSGTFGLSVICLHIKYENCKLPFLRYHAYKVGIMNLHIHQHTYICTYINLKCYTSLFTYWTVHQNKQLLLKSEATYCRHSFCWITTRRSFLASTTSSNAIGRCVCVVARTGCCHRFPLPSLCWLPWWCVYGYNVKAVFLNMSLTM